MKHIKLFEQFVNEGSYSSSDIKKLKEFAEKVSDEILAEYEDDFDKKSRDINADDYTPEAMYDYILDWAAGDPVETVINDFDWTDITQELGLGN